MGLTPLQRSTDGKQKFGQITRAGERTLRPLLVIGASAVIKQALLARGWVQRAPALEA